MLEGSCLVQSRLLRKEEVATDTMAFFFERPAQFEYKAGQHVVVRLISPAETDEKGDERTFSIASSHGEDHVMVATRMRNSAFKRQLKAMPLGLMVELLAPCGSFTLDENTQTVVLLAGGIGITPFRSMILDSLESTRKISLFYSNRRVKDAAFLSDLNRAAEMNPKFSFVPVMTKERSLQWSGERCHITSAMIRNNVANIHDSLYYIAGPKQFVDAMKGLLSELKVVQENIRCEEFEGY
jgi:ferredoxin-NADP reductase